MNPGSESIGRDSLLVFVPHYRYPNSMPESRHANIKQGYQEIPNPMQLCLVNLCMHHVLSALGRHLDHVVLHTQHEYPEVCSSPSYDKRVLSASAFSEVL